MEGRSRASSPLSIADSGSLIQREMARKTGIFGLFRRGVPSRRRVEIGAVDANRSRARG